MSSPKGDRGAHPNRHLSSLSPRDEVVAILFSSPHILTRTLLLLWASWFSIVLASNVVDALGAAGLISPGSRFASGNFALVADAVSLHEIPRSGAAVLFALVLVLELAAAGLFWRAALDPDPREPRLVPPFLVAIVLFGGFLVCDELLLVYKRFPNLETGHFVILCALLLSWVVLHLSVRRDPSIR